MKIKTENGKVRIENQIFVEIGGSSNKLPAGYVAEAGSETLERIPALSLEMDGKGKKGGILTFYKCLFYSTPDIIKRLKLAFDIIFIRKEMTIVYDVKETSTPD